MQPYIRAGWPGHIHTTRPVRYASPTLPFLSRSTADTFDSLSQVYFFILTGLLVFLLPYTYATLFGGAERAAARVKAPCAGWNRKSAEVKRTSNANRLFSVRSATPPLSRAREDDMRSEQRD